MDTNAKIKRGVNLAELDTHHGVLKVRAEALRKQLDKGVPQAEFKQLYMLSTAVKRAAGALEEIRADVDRP